MTTPAQAALAMDAPRATEIDTRHAGDALGKTGWTAIREHRRVLARDLEIERLRATIHRDEDA